MMRIRNVRTWAWRLAWSLALEAPAGAGASSPGVKAGLSAARHHGDAAATDHRLGLGGGVGTSISITPRFSIQPELLYVMKGGKLPRIELKDAQGRTLGSPDLTYAVDYIEVPLLARFSIPADGRVAPYFVAGPSVAFKITEELRGGPDETPDRRDALATTDLGLAIGAGLELGHGRRWLIEARYTAGVTNALADPLGYSLRNGALLVTAGLAWHR